MISTPTDKAVVAFFGGSFNPPHTAHAGFVDALLDTEGVDEVLIAPTYRHPFGKNLAPFEDRLEMCSLAFKKEQVTISAIEADFDRPSLTYDTLTELARRRPDARFRLAIGADIMREAAEWSRFDKLSAEFSPLVIPRKGYDAQNEILGRDPFLDEISSSEIRERIAAGKPVEGLLAPAVLMYIKSKGLYR